MRKCYGIYTALITPFNAEGALDQEGLQLHIERQKKGGVDGLVVLGTTGEAATLTESEKAEVVAIAHDAKGDLPLMVGCGAFSTSQTVENVKKAADKGADMALVIAPFYNKPTQEGIFRHFEAVCLASPIPILVYNHPGRTGVHIETQTLQRIADLPQIIGIKETSGSIPQFLAILSAIKKDRPDFSVISGDDNMAWAVLAIGGDGVISGGANLIPEKMNALYAACRSHEWVKAQELNLSLVPLFQALLLESNPIPLKAALNLCGLPAGHPRLPLTPLSENLLPRLQKALEAHFDMACYG